MTVSKNGYATLVMVRELEEVETATLVERLPGFDVQNAVNSLKRGKLIEAVRFVYKKFTDSRATRTYAVSAFSITEKGRLAIRKFEEVEAKKTAVVNPPTFRKITPKVKTQKQELYQMQNWIIPDRDPAVDVRHIEINGHPVKVTYGVSHAYAPLQLAPDLTRYKPNPIKGIHAL